MSLLCRQAASVWTSTSHGICSHVINRRSLRFTSQRDVFFHLTEFRKHLFSDRIGRLVLHLPDLVLVHSCLVVLSVLFLLGFILHLGFIFLLLWKKLRDLCLGHGHPSYVVDLCVRIYLWQHCVLDILSGITVPADSHQSLELGPLVSERTDDDHTDAMIVGLSPVIETLDPIGVVDQIHWVA